jgi:hypothetical protein
VEDGTSIAKKATLFFCRRKWLNPPSPHPQNKANCYYCYLADKLCTIKKIAALLSTVG